MIKVKKIETNKYMKMQEFIGLPVEENNRRESRLINLYPEIEYQEIHGFGGAFTEATATTFYKLSPKNRNKIIKMYFSKDKGIAYNIGRVHINSCDFSLGNYTCVDENDETLESFQINRDKASMIPMIKQANKYGDIWMFASPWSPPAYMKTTNKMNEGGKLKTEYYELWSQYYIKFINAYQENGVKIQAVTVQNEPNATQKWDSCVYTAEEERNFVKNYLGKKLNEIGVELYFWDHNKERIMERANVMLESDQSAKYVSGIAFHWYSGDYFEELSLFHRTYPNKKLMFSEGCYEYSHGQMDTVKIGEKYAYDMIGNFNNYCNAFCDWNLLLDQQGGPNHVGNYCDAPIMADTKMDEIFVHDSYYYIGHFSKYVQKGARRIGSSKWSKAVETVSFKNPDGSIVSVVLNRSETDEKFAFRLYGKMIECKAEAHSIATYIFERE